MKPINFLFFFLLVIGRLYAQPVGDLTVSINQSTINKLLDAIGLIADTSEYKVLMVKGTYNWQVEDARVELKKGKALFFAKVRVETGPFNYSDYIEGDMDVTYKPETNKLVLQLNSAIFKIQTKALGKKRVIKTLDLANFYKKPIEFDGPMAMEQVFEFEMPNGSIKRLKASIKDCKISVLPERIDMMAIFDFAEVSSALESKTQNNKAEIEKQLTKKELKKKKRAEKKAKKNA